MAILKCKMCGGDISAADGAAFGTCESCGTASTLPKASDAEQVVTDIVIPKMFTDKFINDELAKVNKSIIENNHELEQVLNKVASFNRSMEESNEKVRNFRNDQLCGRVSNDYVYHSLVERQKWWLETWSSSLKERDEKNRLKLEYELKKNDLEMSLRKTPAQRAEDHYQLLADEMRTYANDIPKLTELVEKFREMEGYMDTEALAKGCEEKAVEVRYDQLVDAMNKASTEDDYYDLADMFRKMNGYKDTAELASECESCAVEVRYNQLVQEKSRASTEEDFQDLDQQFQDMDGYKDTAELADECYNQFLALKERREEEERIEENRIKEEERIERERRKEQERIERERIAKEIRECEEAIQRQQKRLDAGKFAIYYLSGALALWFLGCFVFLKEVATWDNAFLARRAILLTAIYIPYPIILIIHGIIVRIIGWEKNGTKKPSYFWIYLCIGVIQSTIAMIIIHNKIFDISWDVASGITVFISFWTFAIGAGISVIIRGNSNGI